MFYILFTIKTAKTNVFINFVNFSYLKLFKIADNSCL